MTTTEAISRSQLNTVGGGVTVTYPRGETTVLSIQPDGSAQTRPEGTAGPYELAQVSGNALVYTPLGNTGQVWILPLV